MNTTAIAAARMICRLSDWKATNLDLQRLLYIANMVHLGRHCRPLIAGDFEATLFGPLHARLHRRCARFGARPIRDIFAGVAEPDGDARRTIEETMCRFWPTSPGRLVAVTQAEDGAWARHYACGWERFGGERPSGPVIPEGAILDEYRRRIGAPAQTF